MSLPTDEDRRNDRVGPHIDQLVQWLKIPYNSAQFEISKPQWADALQTVKRFQRQIDDYISRGVLSEIPWSELKLLVQAFCTLLFKDRFMKQVHDWDFKWLVRVRREELQEGEDAAWELVLGWMNLKYDGAKTTLQLHAHFHTNAVDLFGTVLHEMAHIFIYNCCDVKELDLRTSDDAAFDVFEKLDGKTGHGYYFMRLTREVEIRFSGIFLFNVDLGRLDAANFECKATGIVPDEAYVRELFGDNSPDPEPAATIVWARISALHSGRQMENPDGKDAVLEDDKDVTGGAEKIRSSSAKRVLPQSSV